MALAEPGDGASQVVLVVKNLPANEGATGDAGSIPGWGGSPGGGNGNPLQYSCLENSVDSGAWRATVHTVAESDVTERLSTQQCREASLPEFRALGGLHSEYAWFSTFFPLFSSRVSHWLNLRLSTEVVHMAPSPRTESSVKPGERV